MPIGSNTSIENDNAAIASKNNPAIVDNPAYSTGSGPLLTDNPAYIAMKSGPATTVLSDYSNNWLTSFDYTLCCSRFNA